jgi:putative transposase
MSYIPARHHHRSIRLPGYDYSQPGMYFVTICVQNRESFLGIMQQGEMQLSEAGQMVAQIWTELPHRFPAILLDEFVVMPNHMHGIIEITNRRGETRLPPAGRGEACLRPQDHARKGESCSRPQIQNEPSKGDHKDRPYTEHQPSPSRGEAGLRPQMRGDPLSEDDLQDRPYRGKNVLHGTLAGTVGRIIQAFKSLTTHDYIVGVEKRGWKPFSDRLWQRNYYEHIVRNEDDLRRIREYIQTNPLRWELDRENPAKRGEDEFDRWLDSLSPKKGRGKK